MTDHTPTPRTDAVDEDARWRAALAKTTEFNMDRAIPCTGNGPAEARSAQPGPSPAQDSTNAALTVSYLGQPELQAIRERDAESGATWFAGPPSFTAQAARDRRALIGEVDRLILLVRQKAGEAILAAAEIAPRVEDNKPTDAERWQYGCEHGFPVSWSQSYPVIENPEVYWTQSVDDIEDRFPTAEAAQDASMNAAPEEDSL